MSVAVASAAPVSAPASDARRRARDHALFGIVPLIATCFLLYHVYAGRIEALDFRDAYLVAGGRVLHGLSPYTWTAKQIAGGVAFVYPALAAIVFAPFALLGSATSSALFTAACIAAPLGVLRVLRVRDWRVYGVALLWEPVVTGWQTANLTLPLALGLALVWRNRQRPIVAGLLVAAMISIKPFVWPVALWLLVTRRYAALGYALVAGAVVNCAAWGLIGGEQIGRFLHISGQTTKALESTGYGVVALADHFGAGHPAGVSITVAVALIAVLGAFWLGRRDERLALTVCVTTMLVASPLVWSHYFALVLVPVALARPRLSPIWFAPLMLWACPVTQAGAWQEVVWWAITLGVVATLLRRSGGSADAPGLAETLRLTRMNLGTHS